MPPFHRAVNLHKPGLAWAGTLLCCALAACSPLSTVVGGAAAAGYVGLQDRTVAQISHDTQLKLSLKNRLVQSNFSYLTSVGVDVFYGDVLLTGMLANPNDGAQAVALVQATPGVHHLYNQIFLGTVYSASQRATDAWLATEAQTKMISDGQVYPLNYLLTAVNNHIYILGSTSTAAEHDRVIALLSTIAGVQQVHDFLVLKGYHEAGDPHLPVNPLQQPSPHIDAPSAAPQQ